MAHQGGAPQSAPSSVSCPAGYGPCFLQCEEKAPKGPTCSGLLPPGSCSPPAEPVEGDLCAGGLQSQTLSPRTLRLPSLLSAQWGETPPSQLQSCKGLVGELGRLPLGLRRPQQPGHTGSLQATDSHLMGSPVVPEPPTPFFRAPLCLGWRTGKHVCSLRRDHIPRGLTHQVRFHPGPPFAVLAKGKGKCGLGRVL